MSELPTGTKPDHSERIEQLRHQLQDDLAPVREHRVVFERAAAGDLDGVGDDGAAIARVWLAVLDGERPDPDDVAVMDAYGERDDDGRRVKRSLGDALLAPVPQAVTDPRTWPPERRWAAVRDAARRFGVAPASIDASYHANSRAGCGE